MTKNNLPVTQSGISLQGEIYNRGADGKLSSRVGFVSDILRSVNPSISLNVNINFGKLPEDIRDIKNKLDNLPIELTKRQLNVEYSEVMKCLANYGAYKSKELLNKLFELCQATAPGFEQCIREQSGSFNPFSEDYHYSQRFENYVSEFEAMCDAYATVLAVYLYSATQLHAIHVSKESAIKEHLIQICKILEDLIARILTKNGSFDGDSLLVRSLFESDDSKFDEYLKYSGLPSGVAGLKGFLWRANRNRDKHKREIHIIAEDNRGYYYSSSRDLNLVNKAIELLLSFKAVYAERMSLDDESSGAIKPPTARHTTLC